MADDELVAFRKRWKEELELKKEHQRIVSVPRLPREAPAQPALRTAKNRYFIDSEQHSSKAQSPSRAEEHGSLEDKDAGGGLTQSEDQPEYVSIASGLLDGRTSPLLDRIQKERTRRKRQHLGISSACNTNPQQDQPQKQVTKKEKLVDQFIQDLVRNLRCAWGFR